MLIIKKLFTFVLLTLSLNEFAKPIPPKVWELAQKAYHRASQTGAANKSLMTVIDYSLPSTERRLWVVDMKQKKVIYNTHVAHGSGSGLTTPKYFSNNPGTHQTSLGVFKTGKTYQGKHGI